MKGIHKHKKRMEGKRRRAFIHKIKKETRTRKKRRARRENNTRKTCSITAGHFQTLFFSSSFSPFFTFFSPPYVLTSLSSMCKLTLLSPPPAFEPERGSQRKKKRKDEQDHGFQIL